MGAPRHEPARSASRSPVVGRNFKESGILLLPQCLAGAPIFRALGLAQLIAAVLPTTAGSNSPCAIGQQAPEITTRPSRIQQHIRPPRVDS
jgi:hypothetical protein